MMPALLPALRLLMTTILLGALMLGSVLLAAAVPADAAPRKRPAASAEVWARLRHCESSGRYDRNSGNGYYGAYQFRPRTWRSLGYRGLPHRASPAVQDRAARRLQARDGWGPWPACARRLGLRR